MVDEKITDFFFLESAFDQFPPCNSKALVDIVLLVVVFAVGDNIITMMFRNKKWIEMPMIIMVNSHNIHNSHKSW